MTKWDPSGAYDWSLFASPYEDRGATYTPRSHASGRMVAQSAAEREFAQDFDGIPTEHHSAGGLWDGDSEAKPKPPPAPSSPRHDAEAMKAFVEREMARRSPQISTREWEVFTLFWGGLSYTTIARRIGTSARKVNQAVLRLRAKLRDAAPANSGSPP